MKKNTYTALFVKYISASTEEDDNDLDEFTSWSKPYLNSRSSNLIYILIKKITDHEKKIIKTRAIIPLPNFDIIEKVIYEDEIEFEAYPVKNIYDIDGVDLVEIENIRKLGK